MSGGIPQYVIRFSPQANWIVDHIGDVEQPDTLLLALANENPSIINMASRFRENAMRLATVIAIWEGDKVVSDKTLKWAYELTVYLGTRFADGFKMHKDAQAAGKPLSHGQLCEGLLDVIREAGRVAPGRYAKSADRRETLEHLIESKEVKAAKQTNKGRKPVSRFYALRED